VCTVVISNYSVMSVIQWFTGLLLVVFFFLFFDYFLYFKVSVSTVALVSFRLLILSFIHTAVSCILSTS